MIERSFGMNLHSTPPFVVVAGLYQSSNGSGCGGLTAHDTATYFPGCM